MYSYENEKMTLNLVINTFIDIIAKLQASKERGRKKKKEDKLNFIKLKND